MKKTTTLFLLCLFFASWAFAQKTYVSDELILRFDATATQRQIDDLRHDLGAIELFHGPNLDYRIWQIIQMPVKINDPTHGTVILNNILEILDHTLGQAGVDDGGLNYYTGRPFDVGEIPDAWRNPYHPLPACKAPYPSQLFGPNGGQGIRIAVMDTGVDPSGHQNHFTGTIASVVNYTEEEDEVDKHGHGTKIAGIIAGMAQTGGIHVDLHIYKTMNNKGQGNLGHLLKGLEDSIDKDVNLVNLSLGYYPDPEDPNNALFKNILELASDFNMVFVASAGNTTLDLNSNDYFPASFADLPNLLTVGATNCSGVYSAFSNYGNLSVDLAAPGERVFCPTIGGQWTLSMGTSYATPIVIGVLAQVASRHQEFDAEAVICEVMSNVTKMPALQETTISGGLINHPGEEGLACLTQDYPAESLQAVKLPASSALSVYPNPFASRLRLELQASASGRGQYQLFNNLGQLLEEGPLFYESGHNSLDLQVSGQATGPGLYFLKLHYDGKEAVRLLQRQP